MSGELRKLQRKYGRPRVLSDPFHDFTPYHLRELLSTADPDLRWADFRNLLGPHLPAGTYEEVAYFLPLALDYIRANPGAALDLCSSIVWFCSEYAERLARDGVIEPARQELLGLLRAWTETFRVTHFDRSMCAAKGWGRPYFDLVERSEPVCQTLCDLAQYSAHADLVDRFIVGLMNFGADSAKAAWLLELLRARDDVYPPPPSERLESAAADRALLAAAMRLVLADAEIRARAPSWLRDTAAKLGIAGSL